MQVIKNSVTVNIVFWLIKASQPSLDGSHANSIFVFKDVYFKMSLIVAYLMKIKTAEYIRDHQNAWEFSQHVVNIIQVEGFYDLMAELCDWSEVWGWAWLLQEVQSVHE